MDLNNLTCNGCGSSNVEFDPKNRTLVCHQCGKLEYYSRATLNANGKVVFSKQNAIGFFCNGRFDGAYRYALDVLNISMDNAPALFILGYYEEFVQFHTGSMSRFFSQISTVALEYDEIQDIKKLVVAAANKLEDYEQELIKMLAMNMQSSEDAGELCSVLDQICPYFISRRTSSSFLTEELIEMYSELAGHCAIPKTCFALLKSIETNPDSPMVGNSFYLKSKTRYFYDHYLLPIGSIIANMNSNEYREKFLSAFQKRRSQYEQAMNNI